MSSILKQRLIDIANGFTKYGLWKGGGSSSLSEMTDVTLSNLQANDILKYNGSVWVNDDDLQAQINTLNSNLTDTGWLKTTEVNGNYAYYRKKNGVVYVTRGLNPNLTANTDVIIGTIPTGFRPLYPISNNISSTTGTMIIQILTDGSIKYNSSLSNYITPYIISFPV